MTTLGLLQLPRAGWRPFWGAVRPSRPLHARARPQLSVRSSYSGGRERRYGDPVPRVPPSTGPAPAPLRGPSAPQVLASRQRLLENVPYESYRVAGVSFEGRQELVAQLRRGQPLALVKEPTNVYDPNAVAVQTLDGHILGYVPREENRRFMRDLCFGHVASVGQTEEGMWGFQVAVQPSLPPVEVYGFPSVLLPYANLTALLSGPAWEAVKKSTLRRTSNRCEVTGAPGLGLADCREHWHFDDGAQVVRLRGFHALAPEVHQINYMLTVPGQQGSEAQTIQRLALLNDWQEQDAQAYFQHARQLQAQRSEQHWRLDLGSLTVLKIDIPSGIAPMRLLQ